MQFSHPDAMPISNSTIMQLKQEIDELRQMIMGTDASVKPADYEMEVNSMQDIMTKKDYEIEELRKEIQRARAMSTELPSWSELYEHTKGCRTHQKEFADFRQAILDNLSDGEVRDLVRQPDRRIVPKSVTLPDNWPAERAKAFADGWNALWSVVTGRTK